MTDATTNKLLETVPSHDIRGTLAGLSQAPVLPAPNTLYGIACVAAERARRSRTSELSVVWENLMAALKVPGPWERSEPMFAAIRQSSAAPTLLGIFDRGQCNLPLARIGPIGARGARTLEGAGIVSADQLLRHAARPSDRAELAKSTKLDPTAVEAWARLAELAVVLESAYEETFERPYLIGDLVTLAALASIVEVKTMATVEPGVVAAAMERANRDESRLSRPMTKDLSNIVTMWKEASIAWLSHVGDGTGSMVRAMPAGDDEEENNADSSGDKSATPPEADAGDNATG